MKVTVTLLVIALAPSPSPAAGQVAMQGDLATMSEMQKPKLSIEVLSPWRLFRSVLRPKDFDEYLRSEGPDYVLQVLEKERVRKILSALTSASFKDTNRSQADFDVRYRVRVDAEKGKNLTLYVEARGAILHEGRVTEPTDGIRWLADVWKLLEGDVVQSDRAWFIHQQ